MNPNFRKIVNFASHWFTLLDQKNTSEEQLQALYENGVLSAVLDADVEEIDMDLLRKALGSNQPVLCYVDGHDDNAAYFTTKELSKQWGDDWNDAPYEHNAGTPYSPCWHNQPGPVAERAGKLCTCGPCKQDWNEDGTPKWHIFRATVTIWRSLLETPADIAQSNSNYSVQEINKGNIPWLQTSPDRKLVRVFAGTTLKKFTQIVESLGGNVLTVQKV